MAFGDVNRVNTNLQSLGAQFSLNKINDKLASNQLKLSTGLRINKAEDDSAGFSIASKLSSKISGMDQAMRNIGDAKSMLDIAETGVNSIMDVLIDMKSKATQGATDSVGSEEKGYIKDQIEALGKEIDKITGGATFQGQNLLTGATDVSGSFGNATVGSNTGNAQQGTELTFQVGEGSGDTYNAQILDMSVDNMFDSLSGSDLQLSGTTTSAFNSFLDEIDSAISLVAGNMNQLGINQNSLSIKQDNLSQSITSNSAARSRIQDADFAKVQSQVVRQQIQQQTATAALSQANSSPQAVLGFLGR